MSTRGSVFGRRLGVSFRPSLTYGDTRALEQTQPKARSRPSGQHPVKEPTEPGRNLTVLV